VPATTPKPAIDFTITIQREAADSYQVWLSPADETNDFEDSPHAFIAATFPNFDAAVVACLDAFPRRELRAALVVRQPCPHCNGTGWVRRQIHAGPYGPQAVVCSVCDGGGRAPRALNRVSATPPRIGERL
jgi:hypothetical protein